MVERKCTDDEYHGNGELLFHDYLFLSFFVITYKNTSTNLDEKFKVKQWNSTKLTEFFSFFRKVSGGLGFKGDEGGRRAVGAL